MFALSRPLLLPSLLAFALWLISATTYAQDVSILTEDDIQVNYIYATILGTGVYSLNENRITVIRMPFSSKLFDLNDKRGSQWRIIYPISIGYESVSEDSPIFQWFPDDFLTTSVVPGVEGFFPMSDKWMLKPFWQIGIGRDMKLDQTTWLTVGGGRSLADIYTSEHWTISLGNSLQWAKEKQKGNGRESSFSLFEAGINFKRDLSARFLDRQLNIGGYVLWQHYFNQWSLSSSVKEPVELKNIYEIGLSLGLDEPYKIWGVKMQTFSVGIRQGDEVYAITFGTGFPF